MANMSDKNEQLLQAMIGGVGDLDWFTSDQVDALYEIVAKDMMGGDNNKELLNIMDDFMKKQKSSTMTAMLYIYCNWRVWKTYNDNEELAKKYQVICDNIDDYIFDNWDEGLTSDFLRITD